ncbi:MAG: hypothetical protein ABW154_05625 [Dyella sp.]
MSLRRDPHNHGQQGRTDPKLGDLDRLDESPRQARGDDGLPPLSIDPDQRRRGYAPKSAAPPRASRRGWVWPLLLLLVIGLGTLAWTNQDRLRGLVPSTELNDVLSRADSALQSGRLDGNDGSSARELYEAARALEPDNDRALDGLRKVGQAQIGRADAALRAGQLDQAEQALGSARELLGGGSDVDRLTQAINQARGAQVQTSSLVDQAQAAMDAGKYDGADGAGSLYKRMLTADPSNAIASHGLDKVGDALSAQAHKALDANDLAGASTLIEQLAALLPNYGELPTLRAHLAEAQRQGDDAVSALLKQGQDAMRAGSFSGSGNDNALYYFKQALQSDPDNAQAKAGLGQVAQALVVQANAALDANDAAQASQLLDQATALAPKSAELAAAQARLQGAAKDEQSPTAAPLVLSPQQSAQITQLVQQAHAAAQRGDIMAPPGDCAYDLYRSALAIDGNNAPALQGLQQLPGLVSRQFENALSGGDLRHAGELLGSLTDLSPGDAGQDQLRQRLANAWLDQSAHQLGAGDRANAMQSWAQARKLDPANPRLANLAGQLDPGR